MKNILVLILLLITTSLYSADEKIDELMYMPSRGVTFAKAKLVFGGGSEKETSGTTIENLDYSYIWLLSELRYGVAEEITVGVDINIQVATEEKIESQTVNGTATVAGTSYNANKFNSGGLEDLYFRAEYSLLETTQYRLDILTGLSFGLGSREFGQSSIAGALSKEVNGNAKRGGHALFAGARIGSGVGDFEWRASLGIEFQLSRDYVFVQLDSSEINMDASSRMNIDLDVDGQYFFTPDTSLGMSLGYHREGSEELRLETNETSGSDVDAIATIVIGINGGHKLTPTSRMTLNVERHSISDYDYQAVTSNAVVGSPSNVTDGTSNLFYLGFSTVF